MASTLLALLWLSPGPAQESAWIPDARFAWAGLPATIAAPFSEPLSRTELISLELALSHDLIERFTRSGRTDPAADIGDAFLRGPESILDGVLGCLSGLFPKSDAFAEFEGSPPCLTERIFDFHQGPREGRIFSEFMTHWISRERRFFSRYAVESGLDMPGSEQGSDDMSASGLRGEQVKVLWDALKDTYVSKYKFRGEERVRDDSFSLGQWSGPDFVVLPPLLAGYLWWRGLEKRTSLGDTWVGVAIEPLSDWARGNDDVVACVSLEWGIKGFPLGVIVSVGEYGGKAELDFVGIGTSVSVVRHLLGARLGD